MTPTHRQGILEHVTSASDIRTRVGTAYLRLARSRLWRFLHRSWFAQFAALGVMFALLHTLFYKFVRLKEEVYTDSFMLDGAFRKPFAPVLVIAITACLLFANRRVCWRRLGGKWIRIAVPLVMAMSVWGVAFTGFNYFTNEAYLIDRLLIVGLLLLTIRWPAFSAPLLMYLLLFHGQQRVSAGDLELTDKFPLFDAQVAFVSWLLLRTILPMRLRSLVWFLVALQAVNYFAPGLAKLFMGEEFSPFGWSRDNPLHALIATGYAHGWFYWWDKDTVE